MREPADHASSHDPRRRPDATARLLAAFPGLERLTRHAVDAIVVTDSERRVVLWNAGAEDLYGIDADEAIGRPIGDLFESTIAGERSVVVGPRLLTLAEGNWRGRLIDRPTIGRLVGQAVQVETALSRLEDEDGAVVGVLGIKRDVGAATRTELELATLAAITLTASRARSTKALAQAVLDRLINATGAVSGAVVARDGDTFRMEAARGLPPALREWPPSVARSESPMAGALTAPGVVLAGAVETLPMHETTRALLRDHGLGGLMATGLHRGDDLAGMLVLAFPSAEAPRPSDALFVQVADVIQRSLETAHLTDELEARRRAARRLADQQLAMQSLTELGEGDDFGVLAARTVEIVGSVLGAAAGSYTLLDKDGAGVDWFDWNTPPAIREELRRLTLHPATPLRRFSRGERPFVETFAADTVARPASFELARRAGWTGYAALPTIIAGQLEGIILVYFDRPIEALAIEPMLLESIARTASISLGNHRLRERLVASQRRYRTLFEMSPEPYLVATLDGRVVDANDAAAKVLRGPREALLGLHLNEVALADGEGAMPAREALERGPVTIHGTGGRLDGSTFPSESIVSVVELEGEERALVLVRDLSDQERLQQELIQAQKMDAIGQLVSGVAHELNNPLAAILGFSQLIRRDPELPEEMRHHADLLVEEATRTRRIVQNLLDFARQRRPERYPTSLGALIDSVLVLQSYSLGKGAIEVEVEVDPDLPPVELDRSQIQQVLVNLTQNAIHAIRAGGGGGRMTITARLEAVDREPRAVIAVADDGVGVEPEHVDQLFVPFFTTKPPSEGTGLGLPVSLGIVMSHGGGLRYEPGPGGRGAVFTFDLPVHGQVGSAAAPAATTLDDEAGALPPPPIGPDPAAAPPVPRGRVLVLDDERSIRVLLEKWLRASGFEPVGATTGEEAIELVRAGPFDAILCDHRMAGMNGTEVFEAVVALRPELERRFVFMSGDVLNPQLREFVEARGVGLLSKPFDLDTVNRAIAGVLEEAGAAT